MGSTNSIPVVSQVKSMVQLMTGDVEGAIETQEEFAHTSPITSQLTSAVYALGGDTEAARKTQEMFAKSMENVADSIPVVGHIKGGVHYALGQTEKGNKAMKSSSGSVAVIAGGVLGGPGGAVAASLAYDGLVTGIDTLSNGLDDDGSPRYHGNLDSFNNILEGNADVGGVFDTAFGIGMDAVGGKAGVKIAKGSRSVGRAIGKAVVDDIPFSKIMRKRIRCKRQAEYYLAPHETDFVNSHMQLPGNVTDVLNNNWKNLSPTDTMVNVVSLFMILRLILWNDKNGREYSRQLCSFTATDHDIVQCQEALLTTLREMERHLESHKVNTTTIIKPEMTRITNRTNRATEILIQTIDSLYGILGYVGSGEKIAATWVLELCLYEDHIHYKVCQEKLINKLTVLNRQASIIGEDRKRRVKRAGCRRTGVSKTKTKQERGNVQKVGSHGDIQKLNRDLPGRFESNHVPALSAYRDTSVGRGRDLVAHSLPYNIHQIAMAKVGTSKNSYVSRALRAYEGDLIASGKMGEALKLDFAGNYGRSNIFTKNGNTAPTNFRPALIEYRTDLHAIVNEHRKKNAISATEAADVHRFIDDQVDFYRTNPNWDRWFDHMEEKYREIVNTNHLDLNPRYRVPAKNRPFG